MENNLFIYFKEELIRLLEEERDKSIRTILWTVEHTYDNNRNSENFKQTRKIVLDSINDLYRKSEGIVTKYL
jgi:hypothetical protein